MANIKDIFPSAQIMPVFVCYTEHQSKLKDEHRRSRQADNAKALSNCYFRSLNQQADDVLRHYKVYKDFIILFAARIVDEKINSKNEVVFKVWRTTKIC